MLAYWHPDVSPSEAKEHPDFARIQYAGPWWYTAHPHRGTLATWKDGPGYERPGRVEDFGAAVETDTPLRYLPPLRMPASLHEMVWGDRSGVDVPLACGITITVPEALVTHQAVRFTARTRPNRYATEYGRLAQDIADEMSQPGAEPGKCRGIRLDDPRLWRLLALAIGQRYRSTPEMLEDGGWIAREDVDPLLGAILCGDPKALAADAGAEASTSPSSDSAASQ